MEKKEYITYNRDIIDNAIRCIEALDDKVYRIEIKPYKANRTDAQNRLYFKWLGIIGDYVGDDKDGMHEVFAVRFLPLVEKVVEGKILTYPMSTKLLTVEQFSEYLLKIEMTATNLGVVLPRPQEYKLATRGEKNGE